MLGARARPEADGPCAEAAFGPGHRSDRPRRRRILSPFRGLGPDLVALTVIAGRDGSFWSAAVAHSVWVLVSQGPLVLVLGAMAGGKHKGVVAWFGSLWSRLRPAIGRLVTGAVLLVGAFFLLDAGWWFVTGELLVPN